MSILLVRHGETALNAARVLQPLDTPLSTRGLAQAAALGRRLAGQPVAAILSSDLPRARMTAQAVSDRCGVPVVTDVLLRERDFGELRGLAYDNLGYDPLAMADAPPGGESADTLLQRACDALVRMRTLRAELDGDLVVVSHGLFIRTLLLGALALHETRFGGQRLANTSVTVLDAVPPHELRLFNCTRHLDAALHEDVLSLSGG